MNNIDLHKEAVLFCKYLIDKQADDEIINSYVEANQKIMPEIKASDTYLLIKCYKKPYLISFFDAGLYFISPFCGFRHKIFIMLAILEANPKHTEHFIPKEQSPLVILWSILINGTIATFRAIIGVILLKIYPINKR